MKQMHLIIILVIITLLLSIVNTYVVFDTKAKVNSLMTQSVANSPVTASKKYIDDDEMKGDDSAKVTIVEFSDYECPYCRRFAANTFPAVEKEFIATGKAQYVHRDFPLSFHKDAQKASEAAECSGEQGKFWEYHEVIFSKKADSALDVDSLKQYASELGLDTAKFNTCLDSGEMAAEINKDMQDGSALGITGTPSFMINDNLIVGACPIQTFRDAINAELSGKKWSVASCVIKVA